MTTRCDSCNKTIPLGTNHIKITWIGMKELDALFKCDQLDICSLKCLVEFWEKYDFKEEKQNG